MSDAETQVEENPALESEASTASKRSKRGPCSVVSQDDILPESPTTSGAYSTLVDTPPELEELELGFPSPPDTPQPKFHKKYLLIGLGTLGAGLVAAAIYLIYDAIVNKE
ncbi:hypothetical protein TNCT_526981 [Trichonephila clavata]|uniref:Uncharacterized protein n=1 Tax=Trichonephila clavata TaxID=2740835 RepID=A0A8X6M2N6_TRICU|nr:hypothetical protein TNCT_526981 [Trichonephila clavata]